MAHDRRQIVVDSSDTIAQWVAKVNKMSDSHMGDLDDLSSVFDSDVGVDIANQDSNFVAALNHIGWLGPTVSALIFGDSAGAPGVRPFGGNLKRVKLRIVADSARFDKINIGGLLNNDAAMLVFDDATRFGDSEAVTSGLDFDFNADSATFTTIQVRDSNNLDTLPGNNIKIGNVLIGGTGSIGKMFAAPGSTINITNARIIPSANFKLADSAFITNRLTVGNLICTAGGDSGFSADSAFINNLAYNWDTTKLGDSVNFNAVSSPSFAPVSDLRVNNILDVDSISINRLIMDDLVMDSVETFILGDSLGTGIFAAFTLEESN